MKEIRFGIIGCGLMGREFASAAARWLHLVNPKAKPRIVAVCDTNPALMEWFSGHLGAIQTTTDYRALLANPDVDAVYCAVPHVLHAELYPAILAAGKHLFGEKPFGMDAAQNATITGTVRDPAGDFPLVLKTWRIAPGEANTWSIKVLGMKGSAYFTTKSPRQWQFMRYEPGGSQTWQTEDLGYSGLFPTITGGIFEFGFTDAIQQMWAAFVDELAGGDAKGFPCATPEEAAAHHAVLTAALQAGMVFHTQLEGFSGIYHRQFVFSPHRDRKTALTPTAWCIVHGLSPQWEVILPALVKASLLRAYSSGV